MKIMMKKNKSMLDVIYNNIFESRALSIVRCWSWINFWEFDVPLSSEKKFNLEPFQMQISLQFQMIFWNRSFWLCMKYEFRWNKSFICRINENYVWLRSELSLTFLLPIQLLENICTVCASRKWFRIWEESIQT